MAPTPATLTSPGPVLLPAGSGAVSLVKESASREPAERKLVLGLRQAGGSSETLASQQLPGKARNTNEKCRDDMPTDQALTDSGRRKKISREKFRLALHPCSPAIGLS